MITRIVRGVLRPNSEGRVFELLRAASTANPRPPGMLGMSISRQVRDGCIELVAVTVWEDIESMAAIMGPSWRDPSWLPELADAVERSSLEILETVVSSYEDLRLLAVAD
ncbi:MAG TPA: hypothetical protein VFJ80_11995 [Candidatus Limnocylindrales bacterium]|jgi:hypothetical protein|nr:hypothetical protein [Candidatus Limnocylindrales bacterium]